MPRRLACRFTTGAIRVEPDRRHVTLPRLGTIRTHENTRKLQGRIGNGTARILSATVRQERGRWLVSFQVEVKREIIRVSRPGVAVGVDLGVKVLAVMADSAGEIRYVPNPAHYDTALTALRRLSRRVSRRRGPDQRTGQQPSKRWLAANAERNRVHHRAAQPAGRRPAQAHHRPSPQNRRRRVRGDPPSDHLQGRMEQWNRNRCKPLVPVLQGLLVLWRG